MIRIIVMFGTIGIILLIAHLLDKRRKPLYVHMVSPKNMKLAVWALGAHLAIYRRMDFYGHAGYWRVREINGVFAVSLNGEVVLTTSDYKVVQAFVERHEQ